MVIDAGAYSVLSRRDSGGRLLAAGVVGVIGVFAGGQAVRIVIRRKKIQIAEGAAAATVVSGADEGEGGFAGAAATIHLDASAPQTLEVSVSSLEASVARVSLSDALTTADAPTAVPTTEAQPSATTASASEDEGWEIIEVGRGLANYNSAEIDKVKGQKR